MPKTIEKSSYAGIGSPRAKVHPTRGEIELRAYQIYVERGEVQGRDLENWLEAERDLLEKYEKTAEMKRAKTA